MPRAVPLLGPARNPGLASEQAFSAIGSLWCAGAAVNWPVAATAHRQALPTYPFEGERYWFERAVSPPPIAPAASLPDTPAASEPANLTISSDMTRLPTLEEELKRVLGEVSGIPSTELASDTSFVDQGLDSLSLTQFTLALQEVFGLKMRFRRLMEDLSTVDLLARHLDAELAPDLFSPKPVAAMQPAILPNASSASLASGAAVAPPSSGGWSTLRRALRTVLRTPTSLAAR